MEHSAEKDAPTIISVGAEFAPPARSLSPTSSQVEKVVRSSREKTKKDCVEVGRYTGGHFAVGLILCASGTSNEVLKN